MLDRHQMFGVDTRVMKTLTNIFNNWLPSAVLTWSNKTITGTFIGNITGDIEGDVTGDVDGVLQGAVEIEDSQDVDGDLDLDDDDFESSTITLDGTASCVVSKWTPTIGRIYHIHCIASVANSPTLALSSGITWEGTNDLATFDAIGEYLCVICISATLVKVIANPDSIAFN